MKLVRNRIFIDHEIWKKVMKAIMLLNMPWHWFCIRRWNTVWTNHVSKRNSDHNSVSIPDHFFYSSCKANLCISKIPPNPLLHFMISLPKRNSNIHLKLSNLSVQTRTNCRRLFNQTRRPAKLLAPARRLHELAPKFKQVARNVTTIGEALDDNLTLLCNVPHTGPPQGKM